MPQTIKNPEIIAMLDDNVAEMDSINDAQELINERCNKLADKNNRFVELMNKEYGWGNWQDVNAKEYTFLTREEFKAPFYIIHNPAVREKVELPDDVKIEETPSPQIELAQAETVQ